MIRHVTPSRALQIWLVRVHQQLGWASIAGVGLIVAAAAILAAGWTDRQSAVETMSRLQSADANLPGAEAHRRESEPTKLVAEGLPTMRELPSLLASIEAIAVANGLGWAAADYRTLPASEREPASMEIRTRFTGTYPQIRHMVAQVVERIPAVTFRQLSFTRPSSDTPEVEVKIVFAILLQDGPAATDPAASTRGAPDTSRAGSP